MEIELFFFSAGRISEGLIARLMMSQNLLEMVSNRNDFLLYFYRVGKLDKTPGGQHWYDFLKLSLECHCKFAYIIYGNHTYVTDMVN